MAIGSDAFTKRIERLNTIGIALSAERDPVKLLEQILLGAKDITNSDGGTIYSRGDDDQLHFEILRSDSLNLWMGGTSGKTIPFKGVPLHLPDGTPNRSSVVACAVLDRVTVNIPDAYHTQGFDFSGTRAFDHRTGYKSISFLTVPLCNHENEVIGVLQLLNARDDIGNVVPFSETDQRLAESLASQAATALTKHHLIEGMQDLLESFIRLIATAIDEKSPYTGGHCRRVPELTMMLADATAKCGRGPFKDFTMSDADRLELRLAGWIHDCGKITTPEWVMDKATKLSGLHDRINVVETRFAALKRAAEVAMLRTIIAGGERVAAEATYHAECGRLDEDLAFLRRCNIGGETMRPEDQQRVRDLAERTWRASDDSVQPLLTADEVKHLTIARGTLTREERDIINHHIVATIKMLESLPYPKHLKRIPEFAGGHHERMDGKGYPKGLTRDQMSVQARVMGIADVFEALTAGDRPYKKAMSLSQALTILGKMKLDGHIDPDLFDVFINDGVWLDYAKRFLPPEQIDTVDVTKLPGYQPLPPA
ncbi:MAG: GAF domain-containing protein [Planctomycetes bacterium]|nr:GAF domain-containing protein [Planctomycetota bacterium]